MGYNASGDIHVIVTDETKVALALTWDKPRDASGVSDPADIVEQILAYGYVEGIDVSTTPEGHTCYTGWFSSKWGTWIETALRALAEQGAELNCPFRGEDEAAWVVTSELGSGICAEEAILDIAQSRLAALEESSDALARLTQAISGLTDEQTLTVARIRALLEPQTTQSEVAAGR